MPTNILKALAALVIFSASLTPHAAIASPPKLAVGDPFVPLDGEAISGSHVMLPADTKGKPFVVLFGFSPKGGDATATWSQALFGRLPASVEIYAVGDLSRIPGLFRGLAVSIVRKKASPLDVQHRGHVLLLTRANPWWQIVPDGPDTDAVIVAVNAAGTVTDIERRAFDDAAAADLAQHIAAHLAAR